MEDLHKVWTQRSATATLANYTTNPVQLGVHYAHEPAVRDINPFLLAQPVHFYCRHSTFERRRRVLHKQLWTLRCLEDVVVEVTECACGRLPRPTR